MKNLTRRFLPKFLWLGAWIGLFFIFSARAEAVTCTVTGPTSCVNAGSSIPVTVVLGGTASSGTKYYYIVGFSTTTTSSGSVSWNTGNCSAASVSIAGNGGNVTFTRTMTLPAGYNYVIVYVSTTNSNLCTSILTNYVAITYCTPTPNITATYVAGLPTATSTFTPNATATYGAAHPTSTNTNTPVPTPTRTPTPAPTSTKTPTPTKTPLPTMTPTKTPAPVCPTPVGGTSLLLQGTGPCTCLSPAQTSGLSDSAFFGMSLSSVKGIADYGGTEANPVSIASNWKLTYYSGSVTFDTTASSPDLQSLNAEGILVVDGNLTMNPECCQYRGVIFVTGNLLVSGGDDIYGAVVMGSPYFNGTTPGTVTLTGSSDYAKIIYSPTFVTLAEQKVATYREDFSQRKAAQTVPNW